MQSAWCCVETSNRKISKLIKPKIFRLMSYKKELFTFSWNMFLVLFFCFWFFGGGFLWELLKRLIQLSEMLLQLQFISNLLRPCGHWGRCCTAEWNFFPVIVTFVRLIVLILSWDTQRESFSLLCLPSCCHTLSDDSFLFIFLCGKTQPLGTRLSLDWSK